MRRLVIVVFAAAAAGAASDAFAQPRNRFFVSVNGAAQVTKNPFTERFDFDVNRETGSTETRYPVGGGLVADGGISILLWKNIGAGIAVSGFTRDETANTDSRVPHPFLFDMPRDVAGDVGVTRSERAIHVQALYRVPLRAPVDVTLFAGPSFMRIEQDVVSSVEYDETFPYDVATFRRARTSSANGSGVGFNAGADLAWMFSRHVGIGGIVRFARATVDVDFPAGRTTALEAGGFSGGGGLRIGF